MIANRHMASDYYPDDVVVAMSRRTFYKLRIEEVAPLAIQFLDLYISIRGCEFCVSHYLKPTSLLCPLSPKSAHAPGVHRIWPASLIQHACKVCSDPHEERSS